MNRFNLFFVFLTTLISSALHYSIQDEENVKHEIKSLIYITEPNRHQTISKGEKKDGKNQEAIFECETMDGLIIYL